MLWRFLAVEPCAKSRTELTLFDITRMIEADSIREMFIYLLQPLKSVRESRLIPMDRRPRIDNQLKFDALSSASNTCRQNGSTRACALACGSIALNLADDKLIEVDDLLEMRWVLQAHRLGLNRKRSGVIGMDGLSHRE
jgi:hypothetical protein